MAEDGERLSALQCGQLLGMTPGRWRALVERRQAPAPSDRILGRPVWSRADLEKWFPRLRRAEQSEEAPDDGPEGAPVSHLRRVPPAR